MHTSLVVNLFLASTIGLIAGIYWLIWKRTNSSITAMIYGSWLILAIASVYLVVGQIADRYNLSRLLSPINQMPVVMLWILPYFFFMHGWKKRRQLIYTIPVILLFYLSVLGQILLLIFNVSLDGTIDSEIGRWLLAYFISAPIAISLLFIEDANPMLMRLRTFFRTSVRFAILISSITLILVSMWVLRERQLLFSRLTYLQIDQSAVGQNFDHYQTKFDFVLSGERYDVGGSPMNQYYLCPVPVLWPSCEAFRVVVDENNVIRVVQGRGPFIGEKFVPFKDYVVWWVDLYSLRIPNLDSLWY